ncbi:MAG TPA: ferrochelatase, partial [Candidatus Dormibacteraeota bacterium]
MAQLGVVLATFGSAVTADDVPAYLSSVRGGRDVPPDLIEEFRRRYDLIGRSPLIDITQDQARELQSLLDSEPGDGSIVVAGML